MARWVKVDDGPSAGAMILVGVLVMGVIAMIIKAIVILALIALAAFVVFWLLVFFVRGIAAFIRWRRRKREALAALPAPSSGGDPVHLGDQV